MEVVSPKLDTAQPVSRILSDFWEAMRVHFNPQKDSTCGGHVHVTPVSLNNKFSFKSLKKIAFATVVYEDFVSAILPSARRENHYCKMNSKSLDSGLRETLLRGKSAATLQQVAAEISAKKTETELWFYMQGSRYVLWFSGRCLLILDFLVAFRIRFHHSCKRCEKSGSVGEV